MVQGWPKTKCECDDKVKPFWDIRTDLTEIDGLSKRTMIDNPG